jgi:cytoskeletal protein RodZ
MNDNYLWDRTGEPDPEIQKLEELLGELRYQPQPLHVPADITVGRKRSFFLPMTIAAAIIMVAILSALWFQFSRKPDAPPLQAKQEAPVTPTKVKQPESSPEQKTAAVKDEPREQKPRRQLNRNLLAINKRPVNKREVSAPRLTSEELAEKEQVLFALRLVSAKLNLAQRKTVGVPQTPSPNIIRNQHKIG